MLKKFLLICLVTVVGISLYGNSVSALEEVCLIEKCPNVVRNMNELFTKYGTNVHIIDSFGVDISESFIENNKSLYDSSNMQELLKKFSNEHLTMYVGDYDDKLELEANISQPTTRVSSVVSKDFGQFYTLLTSQSGSLIHGELGYYIRCKGSYNYDTGKWTNVQDPVLVNYGGTYFAESGWNISSNRTVSGGSVTYKNVYVYFWGSRSVGIVSARIHFDSFTPNKNLVIKA